MKTLKIRFFDNLICINAIYTSIRFIRNTNLSNNYHYITSNKVKTRWRKISEKIFWWFSILMQFPENWKSFWFTSNFYVLTCFPLSKIKTSSNYNVNSPCSVQNSVIKWQKWEKWRTTQVWKINKIFFSELFLPFVFTLLEVMYWCVLLKIVFLINLMDV